MNNYIKSIIVAGAFASAFIGLSSALPAFAASTPLLFLTNGATAVDIHVAGADQNATVMFYFPNASVSGNQSAGTSYIPIDIGQTDSSGSFDVSVAPDSYGLSGGTSVYVSVDGVNSASIAWPASTGSSSQNGALSLSQQNISLANGQTANIFPMNTANTLTVQSVSNSSSRRRITSRAPIQ